MSQGSGPPCAAIRRRHQLLSALLTPAWSSPVETAAARVASSPGQPARLRAVGYGPHDEQGGEHRGADKREHARRVNDGDEPAATLLELDVAGGCDTTACAAALPV